MCRVVLQGYGMGTDNNRRFVHVLDELFKLVIAGRADSPQPCQSQNE
jgi:hypothetical protein